MTKTKTKQTKMKAKRGPGRPAGSGKGRVRPVITKTTVSPATHAAIKAEGRPAGRVLDDMHEAYSAVRECARKRSMDPLHVITWLHDGAPNITLKK